MSNVKVGLFPFPRKIEIFTESTFVLNPKAGLWSEGGEEKELQEAYEELSRLFPAPRGKKDTGGEASPLCLEKDSALPPEGYTLHINKDGITIGYSMPAGAYYAVKTLGQLTAEYGTKLPYMVIEDAPDFAVRGVMLDIGRDKIPTMESLRKLIDRLSDLKLNQLQLYMEGYSFEYGAYKALFPEETPITAQEYQELDRYAKRHFIDLVPTQNCFGHMEPWLATDALKDLAENSSGLEILPGLPNRPATLNPLDERSILLVRELLEDLIPNFSSEYVNICMDEPFELGTGKSAPVCAEKGVGQVYVDFLNKVCGVVRDHGKIPMAWGDILISHPELLPQLPKGLVVLDWNYEGVISFEKHCKVFSENGMPFYVCPGTSGWGTLAGRVQNMKANILDAAIQGHKYGAKGLLITDWGDMGHWQTAPISYPGYCYGAGVAWNTEGNRDMDIAGYLNRFIFMDASGLTGEILLELGDYSQFENIYIPNSTLTFALLAMQGLCSKEELEQRFEAFIKVIRNLLDCGDDMEFKLDYDFTGLGELLESSVKKLEFTRMRCEDAKLVKSELENTIRLIKQGADLLFFILHENEMSCNAKRAWLQSLLDGLKEFTEIYKEIWRSRNREGGLGRSTKQFYHLQEQYAEKLSSLPCAQQTNA